MRRVIVFIVGYILFIVPYCSAQLAAAEKEKFTHADTLRGSITPERAWWNVLHYDIQVTPDFDKKSIKGVTGIRLQAVASGRVLQIDLQEPMRILSIRWRNSTVRFKREGNAFHVYLPKTVKRGSIGTLTVNYAGVPRAAVRPPWDGGWIWTKDKLGRPWMSVACQGLGASVWYPCKDHQSDEPDSGAALHITVPDTLVAVGNGRLADKKENGNGTATYTWKVINPINNYDIIPYIGKYVTWHEDYPGEKGKLDCDFWVLDYELEKAKQQFKQVDSMLHCFESWMGPYPFYEDGYKLVQAPHLGMEHQSAVAYGNHFGNGYLGRDLSGTGWGLKWDFIIVHESGHEWFGNSITSTDVADMWIHEGFTNYSETLYTTCQDGVEAGNDYVIGTRANIRNDKPIIGTYGVNSEGSGDMYYKGGNMLHMIRQILGDEGYRGLLHGLNTDFYHKVVTTQQVEAYISRYAKKDLSKIFDQYLRSTRIPVLEYKMNSNTLVSYHWTNCVRGFNMPVRVTLAGQPELWITPTEDWKTLSLTPQHVEGAEADSSQAAGMAGGAPVFSVDRNFYVTVKKLG
ncbi:MAG TPA: M1 family metallopeptidase [Puia sp.]|nr:M1 family metallopeptidase [Puia sp.]